jgi:exopolysaccharide biosynthesis polyprenyl glycosylphosphotransferase
VGAARASAMAKAEEDLRVLSTEADLTVRLDDERVAPKELRLDDAEVQPVSSSGVLRRYRNIAIGLAVTDFGCVVAALFLARFLRFSNHDLPAIYSAAMIVGGLLWVPIFQAYGLYSIRHLSASEEFRRTIGAASIGALLMVLASYWSHSDLSRQWVVLAWGFALLFELVARRVWRFAIWRERANGRLGLRTLIVGANEEATRLAHSFRLPGLGFTPIGYVSAAEGQSSTDGLPVMGSLRELARLIGVHHADCVFVASTALKPHETLMVVQAARQAGVEVRVSANLPQILTSRLSVQSVGDEVMAISLKPVKLSGTQTIAKRTFDLVAASVGLALLSPLLAGIAIAIRLSSKGPVLFRQERITKGGHPFTVYKFRTMLHEADEVLAARAADTSALFFKLEDDPRLTSIGRFLRKLSLDELPQLINVVKGEMSLVGPRPLPVDQVQANYELLAPRHEVPAGVTGWWQVNGRSDVAPEKAVKLDLFYIENWSLSLDLYILLKTIGVILARRGAY